MKNLIRTIQHCTKKKTFQIRVYREDELYSVEVYHDNNLLGEPQSISTTEDVHFHTYHGESAVDTFIRSFIEQIDRGKISPG